jgi:PKD repeat protein
MRFDFQNLLYVGLIGIAALSPFRSGAQVGESRLPQSFLLNLKNARIIPGLKVDSLDIQKQLADDKRRFVDNRYGVVQRCEVDLKTDGMPTNIPGKGTIWQYKIESGNAVSLGVFFKKYRLPDGASLFIYNDSWTRLRGAFTSQNNKPDSLLQLAEFPEKNLTMEYFEPLGAQFPGEIVVGAVSLAYRDFQKSADGRIGINCAAGDDWQVAKNAVCLMTYHDLRNSYFCNGSLVNNALQDETPYFLTANHCVHSDLTARTLVAYFGYENSTCTSEDASFQQTLSGAKLLSGSSYSDFSLLLLDEMPPEAYHPFYAGWDATGVNPKTGACIHHPDGNPKCIAVANNTVFSYPEKIDWYSADYTLISTTLPDTHWDAVFTEGVPEAGSSGAPLLDQNRRIVGQLHGGVNSVLLFGKFSLSWDHFQQYDRQLAHWLDPLNTRKTIDGIWKMPPLTDFKSELQEVCVDSPVRFFDQTMYRPTRWRWHIEPSTFSYTNETDSTSQNPEIVFLKDGLYSVKLSTINQYGSNEMIKKKYIMARSQLDVQFSNAGNELSVCGCDLLSFPLSVFGAVNYDFKVEKLAYITTAVNSNTVLLTLNPAADLTGSFDSWVKVTGTNGNCVADDSLLLHVMIQPNDNIRHATRLFLGHNGGFSNQCASVEPNEPNPPSAGCTGQKSWCPDFRPDNSLLDNSIWFSFIGPSSGKVTIDTKGFDDQIAVYSADNAKNIISGDRRQYALVAANDNRTVYNKTSLIEDLAVEPGKQYWLQVDGNHKAAGDLTINLLSPSLEADVYPNPSSDIFYLNLFSPDSGNAEVSVSDLNGNILFIKNFAVSFNAHHFQLSMKGYREGVYIMRVRLNDSQVSKKLVCF